MFVVGIVLFALGYTTLYFGASQSKAYNAVHKQDLTPDAKGGIPFAVLLGVSKGGIATDEAHLGEGQAFPPFVTGTEHHRPKGQ